MARSARSPTLSYKAYRSKRITTRMKNLLILLVAISIFAVVMPAAVQFGCPGGLGLVHCFVDPCVAAMQQGCHGYPNANCVANYCGGCNAEWYDNGQLVFCH